MIDEVWPKKQKWHISDTKINFLIPEPNFIFILVCFLLVRTLLDMIILTRKEQAA